jgi:predicted ATPase/transcriptional regulator with GAF, ATPase, and Fis domain
VRVEAGRCATDESPHREIQKEIPGYRIHEELVRDAQFVVYRGEAVGSGAVLLKLPCSPTPHPATMASLRRERELLSALNLDGTPRVQAFEEQRGALIFDDIGATPLRVLLRSRRFTLSEFFAVALDLARTIGELHRHRIIHKGLCPESVFVEPRTMKTQLLDFSLASRLPQETQPVGPPALLPARLGYLSPEQTGRMNRVVDYRTDLYSLGATLYEMLTGRPPFCSEDPLELVHGHIAKTALAPSEVDPSIPEVLSAIVMKLLTKTAEGRYQSAWGLRSDLARCAGEWEAGGVVLRFPLGESDLSEDFTLPQHLYGREVEVQKLLTAFERACGGPITLMLVAGYSGIGKTCLVHEVHKPIVHRRGRFVAGKFDQLARSTPYSALLQAFRSLIQQVLAESEERLGSLRARVGDALGANAGVISAVIPDLDLLLGPQPAPPPLPPTESQNRFHYVIENFLGAFARPEHPLVIFLDDLQWADSATIQLLARLLTNPTVRDVFLLGAYRDNEVTPDHPLLRMVAEIKSTGAAVDEIVLGPLRSGDLRQFVADAIRTAASQAEPLADLVLQKTAGNPFFVTQFLKSLYKDGWLKLDHAARCWNFDLDQIGRAQITDNVVELMTKKLRQLAEPTQEAVTLAAAIGNRFSLPVLAVVRQKPLRDVASELWPAIEEGLVLPTTEGYEPLTAATEEVLLSAAPTYKFLHDRVQQAAYALIPAEQKQFVHLRIGRLLLGGAEKLPEEQVFEVARHLNLGHELITEEAELTRLVRLNLEAGRKAKESAAFRAALDYFGMGLRLLPDDRWHSHYDLTLALTLEVAEGEYLCGRFEEAEGWFETLLREARSPLERAEAFRMRIMQCDSLARYADAVRAGRDGLALLGVVLPVGEAETSRALDLELSRIQAALGDRTIASLEGLPEMQDAETKMVVTLSAAMWASAYILGDRVLASLLSAKIVNFSLERGNTADSAYGYATHAIAIGPVRGDYQSAYEWGVLALRVNERLGDLRGRARVHQQFNAHVNLWRRPLETCIPHAREACRSGLETGDFTYAGYGAFTETWAALLTTNDLDGFVRDYTPTVALLERIGRTSLASAQELFLNWARALQGQTSGVLSLSHGSFDEREYLSTYQSNVFCMAFYHSARLHLGVTFEEYSLALGAARTARREAWTGEGTLWPVFLDFWSALAMASLWSGASEAERRSFWSDLTRIRDALKPLAESCPENFRCHSLLVAAETERIQEHHGTAAAFYEEAFDFARRTRRLQHEALANERCAKLWLERGRDAIAAVYLGEAYRCYAAWGAGAKASQLAGRYGRLLGLSQAAATGEGAAKSAPERPEPQALDLTTVLKAAQTIAVEIELDELLRKVMKIALENAGADHGVFLQHGDGRLLVQAEALANPEKIRVRQSIPLEEAAGIARGVVQYVNRTGQEVVLGNAADDDRFAADPYVVESGAKSILCVPMFLHGRQGGILYLENNLASEAFTSERIEMMRVLLGTAAISLETARLYEDMKHEVARRRQAEQEVREALEKVEQLKNRLEAENVYLQEEIRTQHNFEEIVGTSPPLLEALRQIERVAPTDTTVLVFGETGTGKELIARAIHNRSSRGERPLVKVNCGAIASGLVESELFGHVKGAFTGALQARSGRFELADRGTLFLDEVSELPPAAQAKLLRVLQEKEFEPVGSSRTVRVDVRVIAASNRRLDDEVRAGRFRADLLYRLNVFPLEVPPLRDRRGDIPLLVAFFLGRLTKKLGKPLEGVSRRSMERLMSYPWPGNIRELQNVVERAAILATGPLVEVSVDLLGVAESGSIPSRALEDIEREHILSVLKETAGVIDGPRGAAGILGLHPNTLRSRMKKLGIWRSRPRTR